MERSLKIVHVGDFFFSLKKRAPSQFSTGGKLTNGLIRNGHHVIEFSYRDVARSAGFLRSRYWGRKYLWRTLKEFMRATSPDILILGHGYMIPPYVIEEIKHQQPGLLVIQWNVDALFVEDNYRDFSARHQVVDASFISTAGPIVRECVGDVGRVGFLPNPVDLSVERGRNFSRRDLDADVFYACGNPARERCIGGQSWNMEDFCTTLEKTLPNSVRFAYAGVKGESYKSGAAYASLLQNAALGLNISRRADHFLYSSDRLAHMIGNGQLVLIERQTGYDQLFSEQEMGFFSSFDELCDVIRFYVAHDKQRCSVAEAGWKHYHALFNESAVADYMIRFSLGNLKNYEYSWRELISL